MNGTLSFYECRFSDGETQILPNVIAFICTFCTLRVDILKHRSCAHDSPCETFKTFNLYFITER